MQARILFVGQEPASFAVIQSGLKEMEGEWALEYVGGGDEALNALESRPYDAIVANPAKGASAPDLLEHVRVHHPRTLRFALGGKPDPMLSKHSGSLAHQVISQPGGPRELQKRLTSAFALKDLLENDALKQIISGIRFLPSAPASYRELIECLDSDFSSLEAVGEIIERDMAICAKLLQMVNSAFFGLGCRVTNPVRAMSLLGMEAVKALVLSAGIFSQLPAHASRQYVDWLWKHSIRVSRMSQRVAQAFNPESRELLDDAFVGGLLHDLGSLILLCECGAQMRTVNKVAEQERTSTVNAERAVLGCTHAEVGAYLLGIWGLPQSVVEAVAWHHLPMTSSVSEPSPLLAVHIADCVQTGSDPQREGDRPLIDLAFVARCGYPGGAGQFVDACREFTIGFGH